ncbi:hypothetical protein Tco_1282989 [Tanacetum coccineum]
MSSSASCSESSSMFESHGMLATSTSYVNKLSSISFNRLNSLLKTSSDVSQVMRNIFDLKDPQGFSNSSCPCWQSEGLIGLKSGMEIQGLRSVDKESRAYDECLNLKTLLLLLDPSLAGYK